ncbi:MAG TPA: DUF1150 family protein [Rhodopila sp.]|nr:DUF1150 family protein [Rhodopila sp.]
MDVKSGNSSDETMAAPVNAPAAMDIRHISEQQLAALGVSHIAYLKPVVVNGMEGVAIHAADGTPMAVAGSRDIAAAVVMQHEMLPLSVH